MQPTSPIMINSIVSVEQSNTRSVNVAYDMNTPAVLDKYLLTPQVILSIGRVLNGLQNGGTRAWTLTGPYGSGKSYFSLFIATLLRGPSAERDAMLSKLDSIDPALASQLEQFISGYSQFAIIPITGYRASLETCFREGIQNALKNNGLRPSENLISLMSDTETRFINVIDALTQELTSEQGFNGVIFIFDEMGKALEQASHPNRENDVYLLQEVAEHTNRGGNLFLGILHQSFERYASLLDNATQREWAKVQGRFEDIAFQEPPIQQMRLFKRAIHRESATWVDELAASTATRVAQDGWNPLQMTQTEFTEICAAVYPFHPSTVAILPYFFRRLAQNERSIFAFLSSQEPFGFRSFIESTPLGAYFNLPDLFDYLITNFQFLIFSSGRAKALSEAAERLDTQVDLTDLEIAIIKTIGLLNWLSEITHLTATKALLFSALSNIDVSEDQLEEALEKLQERSIIIYRKITHSYVIWQGSDVDLNDLIDQALNKLSGSLSLASSLQKYLPPRPIVARKHSYLTGTTRYFETRYVDINSYEIMDLTPAEGASGSLLICLPKKLSEIESFERWAQDIATQNDGRIIVVIIKKAIRLSELILELNALNDVKENVPELRDDPVARKELRARLAHTQNLITQELESALSTHNLASNDNPFYYLGGRMLFKGKSLSETLSDILKTNYSASPILWNEIVNRSKLSSQASKARKVLIKGILADSDKERFGFTGFPPERSVYENILAATGMHRLVDQEWRLSEPLDDDKTNLLPTWKKMDELIFSNELTQHTVQQIYDILHAEPYGLSYGVAPILLCVFLNIHSNSTTLYQQGALLPEPSLANWELLLARPDMFSVGGFLPRGARAKVIERFARGYRTAKELMPIVRTLVSGIRALPDTTVVTKRINATAMDVRDIIMNATSPEQLLFVQLPAALKLPAIMEESAGADIDLFFNELFKATTELAGHFDHSLAHSRDALLKACGLGGGEQGWGRFRAVSAKLAAKTNQAYMKPIYARAAGSADSLAALESVLAQIANRPPRNWTDMDTDRYLSKVDEIGQLFQQDQRQFAFEEILSPAQWAQSQKLADALRENLAGLSITDPDVIKGALNVLAQEYFKDGDKE